MKIECIVITGGRSFTDGARIEADLRALLPLGLVRVVQGGALGADRLARDIWRGFTVADLRKHNGFLPRSEQTYEIDARLDDAPAPKRDEQLVLGEAPRRRAEQRQGVSRSVGLRRNVRMLEAERPDLVLAYPDANSRGTWQCVRAACDRGITTVVWAPPEVAHLWDFEGEDDNKPGIYVGGPERFILRIDDQRRESHGRSSDGGWANLEMVDAQPRFIISTFDSRGVAERLERVLGGDA